VLCWSTLIVKEGFEPDACFERLGGAEAGIWLNSGGIGIIRRV